jgi:hypothetical protein
VSRVLPDPSHHLKIRGSSFDNSVEAMDDRQRKFGIQPDVSITQQFSAMTSTVLATPTTRATPPRSLSL